jgi:hypothetical protein
LKAHILEEQRKGKGHEGTRIKASKPKAAAPAGDNAPAAPASPPETPPSPPAPASAP